MRRRARRADAEDGAAADAAETPRTGGRAGTDGDGAATGRGRRDRRARGGPGAPRPALGRRGARRSSLPSPGRLATLRRRFHELGAANPFAVDEYRSVRDRLETLDAQDRDLREAITKTRALIADLDVLIATQFRATFAALEVAFDARFQQLFGGGFAKLSLTDPADLSATGIEITARPPGKKPQALNMLSGGERALTAVALLFAMLEVRPAPFCVLDEVDAALDEANVGPLHRGAARARGQRTQFIVITHNRGTIEAADALYGVTVGDDSVSRVISLRLDEAQAIADHRRTEARAVLGRRGRLTRRSPCASSAAARQSRSEPEQPEQPEPPSAAGRGAGGRRGARRRPDRRRVAAGARPTTARAGARGARARPRRRARRDPRPAAARAVPVARPEPAPEPQVQWAWGADYSPEKADAARREREREQLEQGLEKSRTGFGARLRSAFGVRRRRGLGRDRGDPDHRRRRRRAVDGPRRARPQAPGRHRRGGRPRRARRAARRPRRGALGARAGRSRARPAIVLVVGVNGTGKTTTIGKLAARERANGRRVVLAAADTFRAAAIDQLRIWAQRTGLARSSPTRPTPTRRPSCSTPSTPPSPATPTSSSPTPPAASTRSRT